MLIYVQLFGGVVQKTLPVDIKAECSIAELQKRILTLCPGISIKRCIFAGKQLDDQNKTIAQYDVYKESTIQVFSAKVLSAEEIAEQEAAAAAEEKEKSDADAKPASASAAAGARDGEEKEDGGAVLVNIKVDPAAPLSSPSGGATSVPASDDLPPLASRPFMVRQPTNEDLQYGDILVVKLIQARNLMAVDWNGTSDPYALVAVDKQSAKSSIIKKKLNPIWNETFFFHLDLSGTTPSAAAQHSAGKALEDVAASSGLSVPMSPTRATSESVDLSSSSSSKGGKKKKKLPLPSRNLSVMLFDHDWIRHNESLGFVEIDLESVPRDRYVERSFVLVGAKNGEVTLSLQRCTLTSPQMQRILKSLVALGRPIKQADLAAKSVSLRQLLGKEPYISLPAKDDAESGSSSSRRSKNNSSDATGSSAAAAAASFAAVANFGGHSIQFIPALSHLASLIVDPRSRFSTNNQRTLAKVLYILKSQQVVDLTEDLPTRVLWFSNLSGAGAGDEALSPSNLFITLRKHFPNRIKRMLIPKSSRQGCVYVTFKRVEDAILALLTMLDLRPLRACFGQPFEPAQAQLLFSALKAGILHVAGPFPNPLGTAPGQALESVAAAASEGMSDELPPVNLLAPPGPIGGVARAISLGRQNSNCNPAPNQKGKAELEWNGLWVFISSPDYAQGRPAVLYALAKTSDFNTRNPEESKWFFKIELTPARCVIVRSGAWSIEIIDRTPLPGEEAAAAKEDPIIDDEEEEKSSSAPPQRVKETLSHPTRNQRTYFIRAHSTSVVDEWFALLKALRSGETIMSPRKPAGSFAAQLNAASAAATSAKSSPSASPPSLGVSSGAPAASMQPDALALSGSLVPMSPVAQSYLEEINTRVYCTTCKSIKSILDIYTLDAALDVTPTHPEAGLGAASSGSVKPYIDPALQHMQLPISPPSSGRGSPSFPGSSAPPRVIQFTITACVDCLKASIQSALAKKDFEALSAGFSVQDLSDLLPRDQFLRFLDESVSHVVDSNPKRFTRCPKCQCPLEMEAHSWSSKSESFLVGMLGLDKQPMDEAAKAFFLANRFLCRACRTDFCKSCKAFPFHPGYSCKEYGEYLVAPKCRFCAAVVTAKTKYQAPDGVQASLAFTGAYPVCNSAECKEKVEQACGMMLKCGHPCPGARDELDHPPCMYPECDDRDLKAETREDTCSICYTEELGQAPILKLTCGHIFHLACVRQRLQKKWSSTRIAFEFMNCSLCNAKMQHVLLTDLLRPLYHLENQVKAMSLQRLEIEALTDHTDIVTPGGRFYQDPSGFAMNFFMFYQCYDCQEPYFAGQRACGAAGVEEEVKREDLICGGCQKVPSFDECPTHGSSFLIFKCRFCCNFSTFFCFGKTHFCDACHSGSVWPQLVTSGGVNLKSYDQYTQCAGIKDKVLAVMAKYPDKAEQDQILSHTYCDPAQCPIGCRHLPAGFEWGAGCGMCKPSEQKNTEADKLKREEDAKMKLLLREGAKEIRRWKVSDEGIVFKAVDSADAAAKIAEEAKHDEPAPAVSAPAVVPSLSLHAEADVPAGSILGLTPPAPAGASRLAQVVRGASASKLDVVIRHNLTPDGDDLELQQVDAEGNIVPPSVDRGSGGLAAESVSNTWFHFSSKRALAYGCHYFQYKISAMPAAIYPADSSDLWGSAQMLLGIVEEDAEVPLSSVQTPGKPLDLYASKHPAFANNGCKVDAATGALSAPLSTASWRAGDVISLLVDLDQPGGVQLTLFKNGFEHSTREHGFTNLKLHPKHTHVKLIASFRGGAGFLVSLCDINFIDRAQWRFDVDNSLAPEARLPRGSSLISMMANQNAQTHKLRWMPLVTRHMEGEVIDLPAAGEIDDLIAEGDEDEEGKDADNPDDEEWLDQGEGHHDPATIALTTRSPQMRIVGLEAFFAPGGNGEVITLQATAALPIWGMSEKQYYELTVLDRGRGCSIGMGIAQAGYPINRMPGWNRPSYGYHGDDGKKFVGPQSSGAPYGPVWKVGDVVGMCIDRKTREIFYTVNGTKLPTAFRDVDINAKWLPTIGMHSEGERVRVNFIGPFRWAGLNAFPFRVKRGVGVDGNRAEIKARLDGFFGGKLAQQGIRGARAQYAIPPPPPPMQAPAGAGAGAPVFAAQRQVPPAPQLNVRFRHGPPPPPVAPVMAPPAAPGAVPRAPPIAPLALPNVAAPRRRRSMSPVANARGGLLDAIRVRAQERNALAALAPAAPAAAPAHDEAKQADEPLPPEFQEVAFPAGPWGCERCTFINEEVVLACGVCGNARSHAPPPPPPAVLEGPPPPPPRDEDEQKGPPLLSAVQLARAADDALDRDLSAALRDQAGIAPPAPVPAPAAPSAPAVPAAAPAAPVAPPNVGPPAPGLDEPSSLDELGMLPTALLRGFSDPADQMAEAEAAARVAAAAKAATEALQRRREEIEREDRLLESQCEFDGVRHRDLILELQGSSALLFDVPLAPAPKGNNGMERFPVQMKESLKSYTLLVDLMLPKGQLHELPDPSLQSAGIKPVPIPPNPNLRYFPFFDVHTVVAVNDPMSFKSFFIHPSGVVGPLNNAVWKEPDPKLIAQEWSRVAVVVDVARDRFEVWIDGLQAVHAMANFKNNAADKLKRLEMKNLSEALAKKQLRLFAGQVDVRKQDEAHLKAKRVRRVEIYHRALSAAEIWALSGGGGAASVAKGGTGGNLTNNPLSPYLCALSLKPLPPLVGGSPPIHMAHSLAAVDKRGSRMFFMGGMNGADKDKSPGSTVYEIDLRKKPMVLSVSEKPAAAAAAAPAKVFARAHSSAVFYAGAVWWFGGREVAGEKAVNSMVKFTPATNQYELLEFSLSAVPAMAGHAAVVIGEAMYVVGADANTPAGSAAPSLGVWQYVFASNTWRRVEIVANLKSDGAPATEPAPSSTLQPVSSSSASSSSSSSSSSQPAPGNRSRKNSGAVSSPNAAALASASAASSSSSSSAAASRPKVRSTSKGVWHPVVGSYGTTIVVFGGSNSLLGKKNKFAGKGIAGEFVLDASTLDGPAPKAAWRNLLSPVAIGRARGPADATRLYAAGGMVALGSELLFYGGMGACVRSTLYAYHTVNHTWREVVLPVSQPARIARAYHSTGYDPLTGTIVIAGGQDSGSRPLLSADYIAVKSVGF